MNPPEELARLSPAQRSALRHVEESISGYGTSSSRCVAELLEKAGCTIDAYNQAISSLKENARVVIHFHPDRIGPKRATVAQALFADGLYRNQFETRLSSGGLSAFPGGARDKWERTLFGGTYQRDWRPSFGATQVWSVGGGSLSGWANPTLRIVLLGAASSCNLPVPHSRLWEARTREHLNGSALSSEWMEC